LPTASIQDCEIVSHSGRGVVVNDGGNVTISRSYIHDCAATGIYVGSHACLLTLHESDLITNGFGNQLAASVGANGVHPGHSGFYLENGNAALQDCNVSNNSSCGISVSSSESRLTLDHSDVVANGNANQIDVHNFGPLQLGCRNTVARTGLVKVRSRLGLERCFGSDKDSHDRKNGSRRKRNNSSASISSRSTTCTRQGGNAAAAAAVEIMSDLEAQEVEDDLEHLQHSYVVAEENVRFGELIEI
jgi:hypothetical protein